EENSNGYELSEFQTYVVSRIIIIGIIAAVAVSAITGMTYVTTLMYDNNPEAQSAEWIGVYGPLTG
ncbi:MAG: hypothetical protein ACRBB2_02480, partial [Nitrosopumilus sp.]